MRNRIISILISILLILLCFSSPTTIFAEEESTESNTESTNTVAKGPDIVSESAIVMDADTGQIIYEKNAHKKMYPASITKILTALIAIENADINSTITMTDDAVWGIDRDSSHIALDVDEQISFKDALTAMLMVSANEAAWGIADHVAGDLNSFCKLMNDKAASLGCENSNFVNANGLHDEKLYTTAYDMALITKDALTHQEFIDITSTIHYIIPPTNKNSEQRELWQDNKLIIEESEYYYSPCVGGKTGFTDEAGGTLVSWASKDDMNIICVTLNGIPAYESYNDSIKLFEYVFNNYSKIDPLEEYEFGAEELTRAQTYLNTFYSCQNLGTMKLNIELNDKLIIPYDYDPKKAKTIINYRDNELDQGIIGDFILEYEGITYITLPIHYSGYINSKDDAAIKRAIEEGILEKPKSKLAKLLPKLIIVLLLICIGYFGYKRFNKVKATRLSSRIRNNQSSTNQLSDTIKKVANGTKNVLLTILQTVIYGIANLISFIKNKISNSRNK